MRLIGVLCAALALQACAAPMSRGVAATPKRLHVSADGRSLVRDERPFFWLGDTAWELFHRASLADAELYLENRRQKGFTVVQAVILAELGGLHVPNANGDLPLIGNDPLKPNEAYFRHVDAIVAMAERKGIVMALLPTWGDKFNKKWGEGPEIFTPENARAYGEWLGRRYRNHSVVWVLGGDRNPDTPKAIAVVRAMAAGLDSATGGRQLITYHPQAWSPSYTFFAKDDWIDIHMFESGHDYKDLDNGKWIEEGRALNPPKPVLDGEPRYEDHPAALFRIKEQWRDTPDSWFNDFDVRQAAWWAMLAGAAGHTYGNHNIWQMWEPGREPVSRARTPWRVALDHPGAFQMGIMRRILERNGFGSLKPAQGVLAVNFDAGRLQRAARTKDRLIIYSPYGDDILLRKSAIPSGFHASWFDPKTGAEADATGPARTLASGEIRFDPPGSPARGNDWVLVVELTDIIPT